MTMTLLQVVQEFCDRRGLDRPSVVMASTDPQVRQLRGLLNEILTNITNRGHSWAKLQKEAVFTSVAGADQGAIDTHAPYGFKYISLATIFDRTERRPLFGPRNDARWQESKALPYTGPQYSYRLWQGHLWVQPDLPAGHELAFEYASDMPVLNGVSWKKRFDADDDVFQLDEDLLFYGLNWAWRREQGLSYAQELQNFEILITNIIGSGSDNGPLHLDGATSDIRPGIFVPAGNWPV